jgi:hypothetical protein
MAQALGRRGGQTRARRLSGDERRRIASLGGHARHESLRAARRIERALRYAAAARELRGGPAAIRRVSSCRSRLPGIYPGAA